MVLRDPVGRAPWFEHDRLQQQAGRFAKARAYRSIMPGFASLCETPAVKHHCNRFLLFHL
jgi:hypothetical protein